VLHGISAYIGLSSSRDVVQTLKNTAEINADVNFQYKRAGCEQSISTTCIAYLLRAQLLAHPPTGNDAYLGTNIIIPTD